MTPIQPLKGVRILDLTLLPPGAYCTIQLADLGADVVRVESLSGAGKPSLVVGQVGLSRGKRSITLDQRHPAATEVLKRLAKASDVLVENAKPGAMSQRGFGYPEAAIHAPQLIWCSITGFGQDGPYADRSGHDLSYTGQSGLLAALSPTLPWHPGTMLSVPAGAMMATSGVLAALIERGRTGKGCQIDVSLAESSTWLLSGFSAAMKDGYGGIPASPDRRLYECGDGRFVSVAAAEPRTWAALCEGLPAPELAGKLGVRGEAGEAVTAALAAIFRTRSAREWVERLGPLGAAVNPVNQGHDIVEDPHVVARGSMLQIAGEPVPANPIRFADADGPRSATASADPPFVGQHTDEVLTEAGYSKDEIGKLRGDGVIA